MPLALLSVPQPLEAGQPAPGQTVTAEQALANYRWKLKPPECKPNADPDALVVCGRRQRGPEPRLPPGTYEPDPGSFVRGEPRGMGPECIQRCPQPVRVDLIGAGRTIRRAIDKLIHGE